MRTSSLSENLLPSPSPSPSNVSGLSRAFNLFRPTNNIISIGPDPYIRNIKTISITNKDLYEIFIGNQSMEFQYQKEISEYLLLKRIPIEESRMETELRFIIMKYKKFFIEHYSLNELNEILKKNTHQQFVISLFYKKIDEVIKTSGYSITDYSQRILTYLSYEEIENDLLLKNSEEIGQRAITSFTTILSISIFYNVINFAIETTQNTSTGKYAQILPQALILLLAIIFTFSREYYRKRDIHRISKRIQSMLVTAEGNDFNLAEMKISLLHAVSIKISAESAIEFLKNEEERNSNSNKISSSSLV